MAELRFLGAGDAFGSGGRFQACLHLSTPEGGVLLDCGATSLVGLKRAGIDPATVGWVLISHLHGDHFGGIPYFVLDGQFSRRERPLVIAGPAGTGERITAAMEVLFPGSSRIQRRFETRFVELRSGVRQAVGPVLVTAYPVEHASGAPAYALRIEHAGTVLAYSGDTAWTNTLLEVSHAADLFVCEAYTYDRNVPYHLSHQRLLAERQRLTCSRIVLTHMSPDMLVHATESPFECADDGTVIRL